MRLLPALFVLLLAGCATEPAPAPDDDPPAETVALAAPSAEEVETRVSEARARLGESEAGSRVWAAIETHGGLARWYANGPIHFRYRYERGGEQSDIDTEQLIDTWSSRARHTVMPDSAASFGWTGEEAWLMPDSAELPTNARFWSLTPYYFIAMPFVLADPGVNFAFDEPVAADGRTYDAVRVTFNAGTGDAPDDYYVLLLDPETDRVGGVRYVVSYPGFFPEGGATPEKIMLYDGAQTVSGITLQEGFRSFAWTDTGMGEPAAQGALTDVRFVPDATDSLFAMPAGAVAQQGL